VVDWTDLTQYKDKWLALLNAVMDLRVHKPRRTPSLPEKVLAFRKNSAPRGQPVTKRSCNEPTKGC
jgi:hypothetical protein